MAKQVALASKMDTAATVALRDEISAALDEDLVIDGSKVEHLGALGLEVLCSAVVLWKKAGKTVSLESPSTQLIDDLSRFGLTTDKLLEYAA